MLRFEHVKGYRWRAIRDASERRAWAEGRNVREWRDAARKAIDARWRLTNVLTQRIPEDRDGGLTRTVIGLEAALAYAPATRSGAVPGTDPQERPRP